MERKIGKEKIEQNKINFIQRANEKYRFKYDYSKVEYKNCDSNVCIICPEHGEFWQTPYVHLISKIGCPQCAQTHVGKCNSDSLLSFIEKAKVIHGNKYDYSKVDYSQSTKKVCIICPEHGEFWQTPSSHLCGRGCPKCAELAKGKSQRGNTEDFIKRAQAKFGNKYDYSKVKYVNAKTPVCIICPLHGEFWQEPFSHLASKIGCEKCAGIDRGIHHRKPMDDIVASANNMYSGKYDYSSITGFTNTKEKVPIICPIHGKFYQSIDSHLRGHGCPICSKSQSIGETEIAEFCSELIGKENVLRRDRKILAPKEADIYLPQQAIVIEYNGLLWHSTKYQSDKNYHYKKMIVGINRGVGVIQVFEDEFKQKKDVVFSKIRHVLNQDKKLPKIYGREVLVKEIEHRQAAFFLEKYHIQGKTSSSVYLGAFFKGLLIGVMAFRIEKKGSNQWELSRFASDYHYLCCGVGGKLFRYFVNNYNPQKIKSFADRRWTISEKNNLYTKLGFQFYGYTRPDYKYFKENSLRRIHKFNFRKKLLAKKYGVDKQLTEKEIAEKLNFYRIYDCGLIKYMWENGKN